MSINKAPRDMLFLSIERWSMVCRRNRFVSQALCGRHQDARILFVNPPHDVFFSGKLPADFSLIPKSVSEFPRIFTVDLIKPFPTVIGDVQNQWLYRRALIAATKKLDMNEFTIWINNQAMRRAIECLKGHPIIYDITDDWAAAAAPSRVVARVEEDDRALLQIAEHVVVCSPHLFRLKEARTRSLHLIPNGVDWQRYQDKYDVPKEYAGIRAPLIGYVGTLHDDRLDIALLIEVAKMLPDLHFVLLGPNCLNMSLNARILAQPNIMILGARPYADVPAHIAAFSVLMVPHVISSFTDSLDPLKLYEYMASGKPVVATPCGGFRDAPGTVNTASGAEQFALKIRQSLQTHELLTDNIEWAKTQSWESRVIEIEKILRW